MKTAILEFEEFPDDEVKVTLSPVPMSAFEEMTELFLKASAGFIGDGTTDGLRALATRFVEIGKPEWNGTPETAETIIERDPNLILAIVRQWHSGVRRVPLPLPRGSSSTGTSPEQ